MKKLALFPIILCFSSFFSATVISDQHGENSYVIQVGAFQEISDKTVDDVAHYGAIQQEKNGDLIRLTVGAFHQRHDAEKLLADIKKKYPEAFIRQYSGHEGSKIQHNHSNKQTEEHEHPHLDKKEMEKWQHLTEDQRAHAVYLDGQLHLKYGDEFTRVE